MKKLLDLRFVIGAFFSVTGLLLLLYGSFSSVQRVQWVNRWCGLAFLAFGVFMILLSLRKDASDELLDEAS